MIRYCLCQVRTKSVQRPPHPALGLICSNRANSTATAEMNRPRNRQRSTNVQQQNIRTGGRENPTKRVQRPPYPENVPSIQQVVPGASVAIILKQDQPTGRRVYGTVQDVLTRGDHPRGVKVRLTDGRIGRVQGMEAATTSTAPNDIRGHRKLSDDSLPPLRTLADYLPEPTKTNTPTVLGSSGRDEASSECPVCHDFYGDETAVSRHVATHFDKAVE